MPMKDMDRLPLVSAVIPTRNRPELVTRAVRSVAGQTYRNMEIVVVVDGPDRATVQALEDLHEPKLRIVALEQNVGGSEARNVGARAARGEWVALLDDDDEWFPEKIEKQMNLARSFESRFQLISSMTIVRNSFEDIVWPRYFPEPALPVSEYLFCKRGLGFGGGLLQTSTILVSKNLLLEVPFQAGLRKHQDWDWVLRVGQHDGVRIDMVRECLAVWNVEGTRNSISRAGDWLFSFEWAQSRLDLFTPRAYAYFMATECARTAAIKKAPISVLFRILRECFKGAPDLNCLLFLAKIWFFPEQLRRFIRHKLAIGRNYTPRINQPLRGQEAMNMDPAKFSATTNPRANGR